MLPMPLFLLFSCDKLLTYSLITHWLPSPPLPIQDWPLQVGSQFLSDCRFQGGCKRHCTSLILDCTSQCCPHRTLTLTVGMWQIINCKRRDVFFTSLLQCYNYCFVPTDMPHRAHHLKGHGDHNTGPVVWLLSVGSSYGEVAPQPPRLLAWEPWEDLCPTGVTQSQCLPIAACLTGRPAIRLVLIIDLFIEDMGWNMCDRSFIMTGETLTSDHLGLPDRTVLLPWMFYYFL